VRLGGFGIGFGVCFGLPLEPGLVFVDFDLILIRSAAFLSGVDAVDFAYTRPVGTSGSTAVLPVNDGDFSIRLFCATISSLVGIGWLVSEPVLFRVNILRSPPLDSLRLSFFAPGPKGVLSACSKGPVGSGGRARWLKLNVDLRVESESASRRVPSLFDMMK
jgi:hypothetical protein